MDMLSPRSARTSTKCQALSVEAVVASQLAVDFSLFDLPEADGAIALVHASSGRKRLLDPLPRGAHLGPRVDDGPLVLV
eukprot:CAMPEP_0203870034 /NCGR_PEP_ID=MMETSP0359-20131031/18031_1 /ASSEMBLY_ACC=CAM_ASM_000338 /TAXON_ID=268821 /ORGANISM="Scrippsiella Hangoei, Strain SHTV-5" /LENGTH=78 /DNA_ID=CAMNT_0050788695 /DNA_START=289 /DNA_END=526 /DNA_ORIENTATION=+